MEDIYDDLENFNDVNLVNELKAENQELKQKLGQYADSMATLQKDFDNLSAEFKRLETNYSSLLKSARAEIKRKTDMIKNLNIEKDMLVLKQFKDRPEARRKLLNPYNVKSEGRVKKKNEPNKAEEDLKLQNESNRKECEHPASENSSTATEKSIKSLIPENRVMESAKTTVKNTSKETETHKNETLPSHRENYHDDRLQLGGVTDRRISTLASQQFLKFSSDEEFEDMYSALEPKSTPKGSTFGDEPQKGQKRVRDEQQHSRVYYESSAPQDKRFNYTDPPRDRYNKNRSRKFYENDRNMNRDKYDLPHPHRTKYSPDRLRYGNREFGDDRLLQQYDRHRWSESAPGDRYQHRNRERRPYPDRSRSNQNPDTDRNNYSDTYTGKHKLAQIHDEYDQPLTKRFRGEQYPYSDEDRRRNDRQYPHEYHASEIREARQTFQVNDELMNEIYTDLDKPTSDLAKVKGDDDDTSANQGVNQDMSLIGKDFAVNKDLQSTKKCNDKDNLLFKHTEEKRCEGEKMHKTLKYRIPLKRDKPNTHEPSGMPRTKSNKVDTCILSCETVRSSLPHTVVPSAKDCTKISEVVKIVKSPTLTNSTVVESFPAKMPNISENKTEVNTLILRETNQKPSSIGNIVEGDLELSDETNDDNRAHIEEKEQLDTKKKHKSKKKSRKDICKDKNSHLEVNTRKTRSKTDKDKDVKPISKFSELFGDSSSLIAPEDLELVSTQVSAQSAESYAAVCEDAQDGIYLQNKRKEVLTVAAKKEMPTPDSNTVCSQTDSLISEAKNITNESADNDGHARHNKQRKTGVFLSMDDDKDLKGIKLSIVVNPQMMDSVKTILQSEVQKAVSIEKPREQLDLNKPENKFEDDVLETPLMPEVKAPFEKYKDTLKQDRKTRGDGVESLLMPEINTALSNETSKEIICINKLNKITQSDVIEPHLTLEEKSAASSEECKEIFKVTYPDNKTNSDIVETHLMPEEKTVASSEKSKEICDESIPDEKTKSEVGEVYLTPEIKAAESNKNSKEILTITKPDKNTKCDVVETHLPLEVKAVASSEKSKVICTVSRPVKISDSEVRNVHSMPEIIAAKSIEKCKETVNVAKTDKKTKNYLIAKTSLTHEKSKEIRNVTKAERKTKSTASKSCEKNKEHTKSKRKTNSKEDKRLPSSDVTKESHTNTDHVTAEPNKPPTTSSNKENKSCEEATEQTVHNDMPKIFEDTLVPNENISIDKNKTDEENLTVSAITKESANTRIDDTPNLEAVTEDPGLVNTVVISSGIQPSDANVLQVNTTESHNLSLKALATSTPAKDLSTLNTLSEIEPNIKPLASSINTKTANDNPVLKYDESDIPDVRIYCYRRRRKLVR